MILELHSPYNNQNTTQNYRIQLLSTALECSGSRKRLEHLELCSKERTQSASTRLPSPQRCPSAPAIPSLAVRDLPSLKRSKTWAFVPSFGACNLGHRWMANGSIWWTVNMCKKKMCRMFNAKAPSGQWQNFAWNSQFLLNFGRGCGSWFSWVPFGQMFPCSGLRGFLMIFLSELKTLDDFKSQDCLHMTRCWSKHVKAPQPYFYCVCSWGWIQQLLLSVLQIEHNQAGLPPEAHECVQTCSTRSASWLAWRNQRNKII